MKREEKKEEKKTEMRSYIIVRIVGNIRFLPVGLELANNV